MHRKMQIMKFISNHAESKSLLILSVLPRNQIILKQKTQLNDLKSQLTELFIMYIKL